LGDHHSKENPPKSAVSILPKRFRFLFLLWAAECPTHPIKIWVKAKLKMLTTATELVRPIAHVAVSKRQSKI